MRYVHVCSLCLRNAIWAQTIICGKKKKKSVRPCFKLPTPVLFLVIQEKKNKKKRSDAWSSSRDNVFFFFFFLILRAQYLVSVKGYRATWSKKSPCSGSLAEELRNSFSNPYVDSHGSSQIEIVNDRQFWDILTYRVQKCMWKYPENAADIPLPRMKETACS